MERIHIRSIDEAFVRDLTGGALLPAAELVRKEPDRLLMAFRKDYINIYYRGHSLYRIGQNRSGYSVTFDFNHARYSENYERVLSGLRELGMSLPSNRRDIQFDRRLPDRVSSGGNMLTKQIGGDCRGFWDGSCPLLRGVIDDFFDPRKSIDFFKGDTGAAGRKSALLEKQRQQEIAMANRAADNGYFFYDMEYADPAGCNSKGRFDMLALKVVNGAAKELLLTELKSAKSACTGKSGVSWHERDMRGYLGNAELLSARRQEAKQVMQYLKDIFGTPEVRVCDTVPVRYAFIFTDTAKDFGASAGCAAGIALDEPWIIEAL